jgi:cobalt/nickel transport system permease protein
MMDERFAQGDSLLHRRDPKVKIVVAAFFVSLMAVSSSFGVIFSGLAVAAVLVAGSRLPVGAVSKRLLLANSFTLFLWLTLPLTYGGEELSRLGPLEISSEGTRLAALITLKTNTIVLSLIALLATSRIAALGHALEGLRLPRQLCFLLLFSYRYVFVIYQEYRKLTRAAAMRCFVPTTTIHTYRTYGYIFGMTLVKSWNRAARVHQAMLLRGFDGRLIPLEQQSAGRGDIVFLVLGLLLVTGLAALQWMLPMC